MANNDGVQFRLFDTDLTTVLGFLPAAQMNLYLVLNEPGSGEIKLPLKSNLANDMVSAMFAEGKYRGGVRGGFFVENIGRDHAASGERDAQWMSISGRGALALLDDAIVWGDGTSATTRDMTGTRAGMLIDLIDEAQARGALLNLSVDFTETEDSNGDPWVDDESLTWNVGMYLLDVARQIARAGIDFDVVPNGAGDFVLSAYRDGKGADKSDTVYFRVGVNCEEVSSLETGEIRNALKVAYKSGFTTVVDATSVSVRRRRERLLDARAAQTSVSARSIGAAELSLHKDPKKSITVKIYDGKGPRVFVDYVLGDTITLDIEGVETTYRVRGIQLAWDGKKYADVVVDLNSITLENEIRMAQDIANLNNLWETARDANLLDVRFWASIGDVAGTSIRALAVSDAGILYVGGIFTEIANISATNFATYNIATGVWSAVGTGVNGAVRSIVPLGTAIYIGGVFTDANGVAVSNVALLGEGTDTFDDMDGGLVNDVNGLALDNTTLWATQLTGVSRWSGGAWTAFTPENGVDNGISDIRAIAIDSGILYIGGQTPLNGSLDPYGSELYKYVIATNTWTKLTTDLDGSHLVLSLCVYNSELYVGGIFADIMSVSDTQGIARMNTTTLAFSTVGGGIPLDGAFLRYPYSMHVVGADLILGGTFPAIGTEALTAGYIAQWDGETFTKLDTGLDGDVYTVTHDPTNLLGNIFAGGIFVNAGDKPIAKLGEYINNFESLVDYLENSGNTFDMAAAIHAAPFKVPITADDEVGFWNSTTGKLAKISWTNLLASASVFFDTLYVSITQIANRLLVSNASGQVGTSEKLIFDDTTSTLTFGEVEAGSIANHYFSFTPGASSIFNIHTWGVGFASAIKGVFARGTKASPTAVLLDDPLMKFRGAGYDGTTAVGSSPTAGEIRVTANQNFTNSAHGTRVEIYTTPDGGTTLTKALTVQADGSVNIEAGKKYLIGGVDLFTLVAPVDGWRSISATATSGTLDSPSFEISFNADMTGLIGLGNRIRIFQGSTKYFIVTKVAPFASGATIITCYGGTDYTLAPSGTTAITSPYFSPAKAPFGFPLSPAKWTVEVLDTSFRSQASPTANTWYNLGGISISAPIGVWRLSYKVTGQSTITGTSVDIVVTLSTANNTESDTIYSGQGLATSGSSGAISALLTLSLLGAITATSKTPYYLNTRSTVSASNIYNRNDIQKMFIRLESAYL